MHTSQSLSFESSPAAVALGALTVLATAVICFVAWRRSGYRTGTGSLEALRLLIVLLVAITLLQPELLTKTRPDTLPSLVVLTDVSGSMRTRDVIDPARPSSEPKSRAESIQFLQSEFFWQPLLKRFDVVIEPFSSHQSEPEEATDIHAALSGIQQRHTHVAAIVLGSDGDWNAGPSPAGIAGQLRTQGLPVFTVPSGSESRLPDLEVGAGRRPDVWRIGQAATNPDCHGKLTAT